MNTGWGHETNRQKQTQTELGSKGPPRSEGDTTFSKWKDNPGATSHTLPKKLKMDQRLECKIKKAAKEPGVGGWYSDPGAGQGLAKQETQHMIKKKTDYPKNTFPQGKSLHQ